MVRSCWPCLVLAAAVLFAGIPAPAGAEGQGITLYVARNGSEAGSGTKERPFATLAQARYALRERRKAGGLKSTPVTVLLRGGRYELREPLRFGPEDSGTAGAPVTYRSYPGERAVLSGGRRTSGTWRQVPGKPYWQVPVPEAADGRWLFNSLYVNGVSAERARTPNWSEKILRAEGRAPGGHALLTRVNGEEKRQEVPFTHPDLRDLAWFGISAADDADGVFYLDNLAFRVE